MEDEKRYNKNKPLLKSNFCDYRIFPARCQNSSIANYIENSAQSAGKTKPQKYKFYAGKCMLFGLEKFFLNFLIIKFVHWFKSRVKSPIASQQIITPMEHQEKLELG
jgi:hypothetical protein